MKTEIHQRTGTRGGILVVVMVVMISFSLMITGLLQLGRCNAIETSLQLKSAEAFWLAESGLEHLKAILTANRIPLGNLHLLGTEVLSGSTTNGNYSVDTEDDPDWDNSVRVIKKYIVTSTGTTRDGTVQAVALKATINTFGDYLWATHNEENVYFRTGDRIHGRVYTDDRINIYGTPVFYDSVQSAANSVHYASGGSPAAFTGGLKLGVPPLDWNDVQNQVNSLASAPGAQTFNGNYNITFADTKVIIQKVKTSWNGTVIPDGPATTNTIAPGKIIYVTGSAYVKGKVGTRVSVATTGRLYITDDITYKSAANPNPSSWAPGWVPASTQALGLYSKTGVQINSGVGTVNIHAAILTPTGSFSAADYNVNHSGTWYINFYGSIGQFTRGAVGQVNGNGYVKNYNYDTRFSENPPSGMPYSAYVFTEWRQLK